MQEKGGDKLWLAASVFALICACAIGSAKALPERQPARAACDPELELCLLDEGPWVAPQRIRYRGPIGADELTVRLRQGTESSSADSVEEISSDATTKTWQAILPPDLDEGQLEVRATASGVALENVAEGNVRPLVEDAQLDVTQEGDRRIGTLGFFLRGQVEAEVKLTLTGKYPAEKRYEKVKSWEFNDTVTGNGPAEAKVATDDVKKRCDEYGKCRLNAKATLSGLGYELADESEREKVPTPPERFKGSLGFVPGDANSGGSGRRYDYAVLVEDGIKIDRKGFAKDIADTLGDSRSWKRSGEVSFKQVRSKSQADTRVILASPDLVDRLCAPLDTDGYVSCTQGSSVILNLDRWRYAVPHFESRREYRRMVTNHEIGHRIGQGHRNCTGSGNKAPVMQQQTYGLQGCKANAWPLDYELRSVRSGSRAAPEMHGWLD